MGTDIYDLINWCVKWAIDRNFYGEGGATPIGQYQKTVEEVEELRIALDNEDIEEIKDAIGDIMVTLIVQCKFHKLSIAECLEHAYNNIKDRKGKMVDGKFVKEIGT